MGEGPELGVEFDLFLISLGLGDLGSGPGGFGGFGRIWKSLGDLGGCLAGFNGFGVIWKGAETKKVEFDLYSGKVWEIFGVGGI